MSEKPTIVEIQAADGTTYICVDPLDRSKLPHRRKVVRGEQTFDEIMRELKQGRRHPDPSKRRSFINAPLQEKPDTGGTGVDVICGGRTVRLVPRHPPSPPLDADVGGLPPTANADHALPEVLPARPGLLAMVLYVFVSLLTVAAVYSLAMAVLTLAFRLF